MAVFLLALSCFVYNLLCVQSLGPLATLRGGHLRQGCPCEAEELCERVSVVHDKEVFGFSLVSTNYHKYDWAQLTSVAWNVDPQLLCLAHANNARVVFGAQDFQEVLQNSTAMSEWVEKQVVYARENFLDGINFDLEDAMLVDDDVSVQYTRLVALTAKVFHKQLPGSQVSVDVPWSPYDIDGRNYDWLGLSAAADLLFIMAYDLQSQIFGRCVASANAPPLLVAKGLRQWLEVHIPKDKLVLGLPWYAYVYECQPSAPYMPVAADVDICVLKPTEFRGVPCSDAAGEQWNYFDVMKVLHDGRNTTPVRYDPLQRSSYFNFRDTSAGHAPAIKQVWFDNPDSLAEKYRTAKEVGIRGVGVWHLDALDYPAPPGSKGAQETAAMWDALHVFTGDE